MSRGVVARHLPEQVALGRVEALQGNGVGGGTESHGAVNILQRQGGLSELGVDGAQVVVDVQQLAGHRVGQSGIVGGLRIVEGAVLPVQEVVARGDVA